MIHRIDRAAGKHEFRRQKRGILAALAHQDARPCRRIAQHDHRGRIADGAFVDQNPCIRLAHCTPTISPLKRGNKNKAIATTPSEKLTAMTQGSGRNRS